MGKSWLNRIGMVRCAGQGRITKYLTALFRGEEKMAYKEKKRKKEKKKIDR